MRFYPQPKVDSAALEIKMHDSELVGIDRLQTFFLVTKAGFSQKRKTLRNSLSAGLHLPVEDALILLNNARIDPMRRAESLDLEEWVRLTDKYLMI